MARAHFEELSPREQDRLKRLFHAPNSLFYAALHTWATTPGLHGKTLGPVPQDSEDRVFLHPLLHKRSMIALRRWIGGLTGEMRKLNPRDPSNRRERERIAAELRMLGRARTRLRQSWALANVAVGDIELPDLAELMPGEISLLEKMKAMLATDRGEFEDAVYLWATSGRVNEEADRVFQHPELVQQTVKALTAHIKRAQAEQRDTDDPEVSASLHADLRLLGIARTDLKPHVNLALAGKAKSPQEEQALSILRSVYYPEYKAILRALREGMSGAKAKEQALEARMTGVDRRPRKKPNRRKRR